MIKGKERINYLKKIGLSEPIIQMAQGEILHPSFDSAYEEPSYIHEMKNIPDNITPLWELESFQTVVLEENNHIFFVQFNLDDLDKSMKNQWAVACDSPRLSGLGPEWAGPGVLVLGPDPKSL